MSRLTRWMAVALTLTATHPAPAAAPRISDGVVKIGVLTDMTGPSSDLAGPGSLAAAQMAAEDLGLLPGARVVVVSADHRRKPEIAATIARRWIDEEQVDVIVDLTTSSTALAVMPIAAEKKRITLLSGPDSDAITGDRCTAYNVHYTYNAHAMIQGTGKAVVENGGKTWFFITADSVDGQALQQDAARAVIAAGGEVKGRVVASFPGTAFSSALFEAQASRAQVIGLASAGLDTLKVIQQAHQFGITPWQKLAGVLLFLSDVHLAGLESAQGAYLTTAFYWDRDGASRAWSKRFFTRTGKMPTMVQAGVYSEVMHYLRAVKKTGTDQADAVMQAMRDAPVDDFFARGGRIGPDGLMRHDMYLAQVKKPNESKGPWDYYRIVKTIPADQAFQPLSSSTCPLVPTTASSVR